MPKNINTRIILYTYKIEMVRSRRIQNSKRKKKLMKKFHKKVFKNYEIFALSPNGKKI